ncbi:hypothetical protein EZS27_014627, partial [termite gut metagenome]
IIYIPMKTKLLKKIGYCFRTIENTTNSQISFNAELKFLAESFDLSNIKLAGNKKIINAAMREIRNILKTEEYITLFTKNEIKEIKFKLNAHRKIKNDLEIINDRSLCTNYFVIPEKKVRTKKVIKTILPENTDQKEVQITESGVSDSSMREFTKSKVISEKEVEIITPTTTEQIVPIDKQSKLIKQKKIKKPTKTTVSEKKSSNYDYFIQKIDEITEPLDDFDIETRDADEIEYLYEEKLFQLNQMREEYEEMINKKQITNSNELTILKQMFTVNEEYLKREKERILFKKVVV